MVSIRFRHIKIGFIILIVLTPAGVIFAQNTGLYGSDIPQDSAFIRVINNSTRMIPEINVGRLSFRNIEKHAIQAYRPLVPGVYIIQTSVSGQGKSAELAAGEGLYYTIVIAPSGLKIFEDTRHRDPLRTQLVVYNVSSITRISLRTTDGRTTVIEEVVPDDSSSIVVNPVAAGLSIFSGREALGDLGTIQLEPGQSYSIFVRGDPSRPEISFAKAEVQKK